MSLNVTLRALAGRELALGVLERTALAGRELVVVVVVGSFLGGFVSEVMQCYWSCRSWQKDYANVVLNKFLID